jgi:hypothetical protein
MTETLAKKVTPTAAFRAVMAPYRDKLEKSDASRGKLEGRLRRAFDLFDEEMREIWGNGDPEAAIAADPTNGPAVEAS